jgi:glycosyltransferase involved in cell wall biosynthesis
MLPGGLRTDILSLYREFRTLRPEVVHAWLDWSNVRAGVAAVLAGVPRIILSGRNMNPSHFGLYQGYMDPAYKALLKHPSVILSNNSYAGAEDYARWLGLPGSRIPVVHNGVDFSSCEPPASERVRALRRSFGVGSDAPLIGGVFRLFPEKRPMLWLRAAACVLAVRPEARFLLFGDGILRDELERYARRPEFRGRVIFGGVTDDVLTSMAAFDVFLLTSSGEGIPNVVLEAQWMGTPVVACDAGGTREAIEHGETGWIVENPSPEAIASRVLRTLDNHEWRNQVHETGPAFVMKHFGLERMIDDTLALYFGRTRLGSLQPDRQILECASAVKRS